MELFTLVASLLSPLNLYETITLGIGLCLVRLLSGKDWKMRRDPIYTLCLGMTTARSLISVLSMLQMDDNDLPTSNICLIKTYLIYYSRL